VEEMMAERGINLDHSTLNRWVIHYSPEISKEVKRRRRPIGESWRLDETYVKVQGQWKYLYRAVDKENNTIDFLLTAKRDKKAARRFLNKAIKSSGEPVKINIDKSGANTAAIESYNKDNSANIEIRQNKYLNNIVEQDHRFIKKKVRPILGFKKFRAAQATIAGVEAFHMIKKGQLRPEYSKNQSAVEQFYSLAA
jgi:transposase-like protein